MPWFCSKRLTNYFKEIPWGFMVLPASSAFRGLGPIFLSRLVSESSGVLLRPLLLGGTCRNLVPVIFLEGG